ncbi:MAG: hypothetical protein IPN69_22230 [Acidobacteria bacterium]|nr:hypothetical protein [Acidobacteriota bacterium]MBK8813425.1 hypothetical protein [Acidobacteriota bacterium]
MGSKYRQVQAVGQINDMACWAASLKWWYKAAMSINASQAKLWDHYKHLREPLGGMTDSGMKHIIRENAMTLIEYPDATNFQVGDAQWLVGYGPVFIAYTTSFSNKRHVNVIYEVSGDEDYAEVRAMEPQAVSKGGGLWSGAHQKKPINEFNMSGSIWAGVLRKAFAS